jgi:hypothetical protein
MNFVLDIGGEGRHPEAWNLNCRQLRTLGPDAGRLIPRLILGRADAIPLQDGCVDEIIVERTPLNALALAEIRRITSRNGRVVLRHARAPWSDPHRMAIKILGVPVQQAMIQRGTVLIQESRFHPILLSP